jgi:hypothetical protein
MEDLAPPLNLPADLAGASTVAIGVEAAPVREVGVPTFFATVVSRPSLSRCIPIASLVGTVLSAVNQGSVILGGKASMVTWIRVATNYLTPFIVSSSGFFASQRSVWRSKLPAGQ